MSLQLWLPLTGNLNNNGLADATITNSGATVDAMGKIGSCYRFNKNAYLSVNKEVASTNISGEGSFCLWLKINSFNTNWDTYVQIGLGTTPWAAYIMGLLRSGASSNKLAFTISNTSTSSSDSYKTPDLTLGQWYHIACVYREGHCLIYINGSLHQDYTTTIVPKFSSVASIVLGGLSSTYKSDCYLNDFRYYDHALSTKEVKEISKALILHMPLDNNGIGNPNLINSSVDTTGRTITGWEANQNVTFSIVEQDGVQKIKCKSAQSTSTPGMKCRVTGLTANTSYTISCRVQTFNLSSGVSLQIWKTSSSAAISSIGYTQYANETKISLTFNTGSETSILIYLFMYGVTTESYILARNFKLELGTIASQYVPNIESDNIVYDTSGYCNNGTYSTNRPTPDADSPRYSSSMLFNGSNNFIICGRGSFVRDAITVNFWAYMANWGSYTRAASCTEGGGWNFEPGSGSKMNFAMGTGVSGCTYKSALAEQTFASLSGWVMFTGTYDGFATKIYINGVLSNTNNAYTTKTPIFYNANNGLFIGAEAGSSPTAPVGSYFNGKISDFRIYATALSADDIADLYNKPISIDNTGKVFALDYTEM